MASAKKGHVNNVNPPPKKKNDKIITNKFTTRLKNLNTGTGFWVRNNSIKNSLQLSSMISPGLCSGPRRTNNRNLVCRKASIFVIEFPCQLALLGSSLPWTGSNVFKWIRFFHSKQLLHLDAYSKFFIHVAVPDFFALKFFFAWHPETQCRTKATLCHVSIGCENV